MAIGSLVESGTGLMVRLSVMACVLLAVVVCRQTTRWLRQHSTAAERAVLRQLGREAAVYVQAEFRHMPVEARLEEAVRYVLRTAKALGMQASSPEIRAMAHWGMNELRFGDTPHSPGEPSTQPAPQKPPQTAPV